MAKYSKEDIVFFNNMIREFNLSKRELYKRIIEYDWDIRTACIKPLFIYYNGRSCTIEYWAKLKKIPVDILYKRIGDGWDTEKALTTPINVN